MKCLALAGMLFIQTPEHLINVSQISSVTFYKDSISVYMITKAPIALMGVTDIDLVECLDCTSHVIIGKAKQHCKKWRPE